MSQVKAKKKLQYYQNQEVAHSELKDVFTLRGRVDTLLDDIDADSELGLPLLSPLPKSTGVNHQNKSSSDPEKIKASSEQVHKIPLIQGNGIQEDEIIDRESPFKEIVPIKTSSPIALATERDESVDGVRPVGDPLLFGVEDEEPIGGDFSKASCTQQSEPAKESLYGDSGSLESPPERLKFRKTAISNAGSLSSMKLALNTKTSVQATQSSPPELKNDLIMDKNPGQLSSVLVRKSEPNLRDADQCRNQVMEDPGKGLSFQQKLKKALKPKSPCSRKEAAVPAPPPVNLEEDFIILDDEAPVLFVIPRKTEANKCKRPVPADTAKDVLTEPHSTDQLSQSDVEMTNQQGVDAKRNKAQIESGKQKPKGKRGKASKKSGKDSVTHDDGADPVTEALEDNDCDQPSSQSVQGRKEVQAVTGKKRANSKAPDPVELSDKDETDASGSQEIPAPVSRTTKKSSKSSKQERPGSNAKKESHKFTAAKALHSTNSVKSNRNRKNSKKEEAVSKTKKQTTKKQMELEQIDPSYDEQEHEPPLAFSELEEEQRTAVNKQSSTKEDAVDTGKKQKRKETQTAEPKLKDPPTTASDISSDSLLCVKRKRKPPGAWWLSSPDEGTAEPQPKQVLGTAQGLKASTKTQARQAAAVDSEETQSLRPAQGKQKKPKTNNVLDDGKKLIAAGDGHDTGAEQKTAKNIGGRRKPKLAVIKVPSQAHVSGEEVGACPSESAVEISPEFNSPNKRHDNLLGEKRVFDQVYSRDIGSSKKPPSSSLRRPETSASDNFPQKRQRKAPSNWWEAQQSQEPADILQPPSSSPPQKTKLSNTPLCGALNKEKSSMKSQKTKNQTRNIKRNIINTPKSIKRSLASMNAIFDSEKPESTVKSGQRCRKQGRRNLLHSLEDQSDHSSENVAQSDDQLKGNGRTSFVFTSGVTLQPSRTRNKMSVRVSSGTNTLSDVDAAFRSGPSSMLELQQCDEEDDDIDLPSSRVTPHVQQAPRVFAQCSLCGPPLQPVVLEDDDWTNLHTWFSNLWPPSSKNGRVISPDDFHWYSHGGRAMGHAVDLQSQSFSHGKILLGSYMKKPSHVDHDMVSVFSIISSCVRVEIEGVKSVYNSGEVFMIPSGQVYSILNLCQEPAVLIYHRTQSNDTPN